MKRVFILIIAVFLIGPLCVFSQEKNIPALSIGSGEGKVLRGSGFKVLVGPDVKFKKQVGPDFDVYRFSYKGEYFLGAYSGDHPSFGEKFSETLVRATEKWTYVSARCHTEVEDDQSVNKECLVDWGDRGFQFPQYVHFFFNLNDREMQDRAEKMMASVQHNPVVEDTLEKPAAGTDEDSTETPKMKRGANINAVDEANHNFFQIISEQNRLLSQKDLDILSSLFKGGLDPNAHPKARKILLEKLKPYLEVHSLFEKYGKKNRQLKTLDEEYSYIGFHCGVGDSSMTPLITAVKNKDYKGVKKLIKEGADVNEMNAQRTPLSSAVFQEDQKMVDLLLMLGADINRVDKDCPNSPLHDATYRGYYLLVEHLIKKGAEINIRNYLGKTPLHLASKMGHYQTTKTLLEANPTMINLKDPDGDTALQMAFSKFTENPKKRISLIRLLLENGASPHLKNKAGKSPLDLIQVYPKIYHLVLSHSKNP